MTFRFDVQTAGLETMAQAIAEIGPTAANQVYPFVLAAQASVVRKKARQRGYVYNDITGRLRKSIRSRRVSTRYFGRTYKRGRSIVTAGGPGARQAHLVHQGHGGPRPARPYPFLRNAVLESVGEMNSVTIAVARERFPRVIARLRARQQGGSRVVAVSRTIARRARSRR